MFVYNDIRAALLAEHVNVTVAATKLTPFTGAESVTVGGGSVSAGVVVLFADGVAGVVFVDTVNIYLSDAPFAITSTSNGPESPPKSTVSTCEEFSSMGVSYM